MNMIKRASAFVLLRQTPGSRQLAAIFRLSLVGLTLAVGGCSFPQAQRTRLLAQWNARCKEAADLLESVKDVASAQAASPKIIAVMKELQKLDEQLEASEDPEDMGLVDMGVTTQVGEGIGHMQRLVIEGLRIGKEPELRAALGDAWNYLPTAMMVDEAGNLREG